MIKLIDILHEIEFNKILTPRRSEERDEKYIEIINKQIQQYINNGSKGDLDLYNMQITSLPDNLKVGRSLNLEDNPITFLPNNLQVGKDLYLGNTEIISLPDNLKIGGVNNSQHTIGTGTDFKSSTNLTPTQIANTIERLILEGKMKQGGVGIYPNYVHYDTRGTRARWTGVCTDIDEACFN